jgi:hypothetical protein
MKSRNFDVGRAAVTWSTVLTGVGVAVGKGAGVGVGVAGGRGAEQAAKARSSDSQRAMARRPERFDEILIVGTASFLSPVEFGLTALAGKPGKARGLLAAHVLSNRGRLATGQAGDYLQARLTSQNHHSGGQGVGQVRARRHYCGAGQRRR